MGLSGPVLLSAGGTGGHLFPAEALALELKARGHSVHLVTDVRAEKFAGHFPADKIHVVPSATIGSKNPLAIARALLKLWSGYRTAGMVVRSVRPAAVVGFGGYPTVPPLMAAVGADVPSIIHEQNGVMGRANRLLAGRVNRIAGGFLKASGSHAAKIVEVGNPARQSVLDVAGMPYDKPAPDGELRVLVFGGSQGARYFSDSVPEAIALLPEGLRSRLKLVQQARPEDEERLRGRYAEMGVSAEVNSFFSDLPARMAKAHLVLSRSGASTVNELSIIGRPSILVPLPHALDDDQGHNARILVEAGGALMRRQPDITTQSLAADLETLLSDPARLQAMAAGAKSVGRTNATQLLADLVEAIAAGSN
ncbi:undecaprenyldiphospho-muramoylpentapeptide beta-N-acetylglucosaminyltransferase [Pseudohoeflea suaedae]|uniref:UDP-N-acetylglucosamine--N-acetylmuramyl-(pentapeptide) pyrophosphoryl-undecaprenol N-acetylglucosamine transferase n=1 Tax=Pseudohoeflea suaedae TaxID=877384 RepID=A0A4V3A6T2_9HYPH|nr:undecaprenyldiphospho-muramoylpentapeptide beta-N-acetylglucosaminyltransferase [Pseudohoeflea suaedae]TDH34259.1 undecaprenyldiphospho-muramoylpentapeptide beta-N-acetylglucosaminyltransferase [Pseudohoeflea suaedae]